MENYLGFDLGGTKCTVILGCKDTDGLCIVARVTVPMDLKKSPNRYLEELCFLAETLLNKHHVPRSSLAGIGVSCGGPLDSKSGIIQSPPNLPGWDDVHVISLLHSRFGAGVRLQNDANACAIAEWKYGAARGCDNVIFLTFGTGMGAGLILNSRLYEGACGMAGEIGHIRISEHGPAGYGKEGSFEGYCSGGGIARLAGMMALERFRNGEKVSICRDAAELSGLTAKAIADAADAGDEFAREVFNVCGHYLGRGLSILIDMLNPEIIVIGSIYARREALLRDAAIEQLERETLEPSLKACRIVPAGLGERIGDYAALATACGDY